MKKHLITFILIASAFTSFSQDLCLQEKNYQIKNQKVIKISNKITTYYFFTVNGIGSILEYNSQVLRVRCSPSPNVCIGIYDLADGSGRLGLHYYDGPDRVRLNFTL